MIDCHSCANYRPRASARPKTESRKERYMAYIEDSLTDLPMAEKFRDLRIALAYVFEHLPESVQDGLLSEEARDQDLRNQQRARDLASVKHPF
mgnify:CR=1 FL=1